MRRMLPCLLFVILGPTFAFAQSAPTPARPHGVERFDMVLWACQRDDAAPRFSHTWATFIRYREVPGLAHPRLEEAFTISRMPDSGTIPIVFMVRGRNYTLDETLKWAAKEDAKVVAFGPTPIRQELFQTAKARKAQLERGHLSYKMLDDPVRPNRGLNCIHAVSDMLSGPLLDTGTARGEDATQMVAEHLRPYMIRPEYVDAKALDLISVRWDEVEHHAVEASEP